MYSCNATWITKYKEFVWQRRFWELNQVGLVRQCVSVSLVIIASYNSSNPHKPINRINVDLLSLKIQNSMKIQTFIRVKAIMKWMPRRLESPATRLFIKELDNENKQDIRVQQYYLCITLTNGQQWASYRIRKIVGCASGGNAWNVFPPSRHASRHVRDASAVMHAVMAYYLFALKSMAGKTFPAIPTHAQPAILRIW